MRFTERQKELVLAAALRHCLEPSLFRTKSGWAVIGRNENGMWHGRAVHEIDRDDRVWWSDTIDARTRREVKAGLMAAEDES